MQRRPQVRLHRRPGFFLRGAIQATAGILTTESPNGKFVSYKTQARENDMKIKDYDLPDELYYHSDHAWVEL